MVYNVAQSILCDIKPRHTPANIVGRLGRWARGRMHSPLPIGGGGGSGGGVGVVRIKHHPPPQTQILAF